MIFNPYFNYYNGNIKDAKPIGYTYLSQMIRAIKEPKPKIVTLINQIREASNQQNESLKAELKQRLFSFTPAVICYPKRKYECITDFTGLMVLDFDKLSSKNDAIELKKALFDTFDFIICTWLSSSGKGVRALVKIPKVNTVKEYKLHFHAFENNIGKMINGFDFAPQNPVLPLFLSHDPEILFRLDAKIYTDTFDKEAFLKAEREKLAAENRVKLFNKKEVLKAKNKEYKKEDLTKKEIVEKIIIHKLSHVTNVGHPVVRAVSYAVGGYIAEGYIEQYDAEKLIFEQIDSHGYLRQKEKIYKQTVLDMIEKGKLCPLKIEDDE